jgi:RND family efflux transporter MFP subunit
MGIRSSRSQLGGVAANAGGTRGSWAGFLAALIGAVVASGCEHDSRPAAVTKAVKVVVTRPVTGTVIDYQDFTGRLEAVKTIEVRARVSGYVTEIPFKEGDRVKEGQLLFQIDPRPYQVELNQAEANLKVAHTDRQLHERNAERARKLILTQSISREEYDAATAALEKSVATIGAVEAAKEKAKLYLDYTRVVAPISGRISRRYVDPGNLVNADNTILTTIVTENRMYAYFDVDERTYLELLTMLPAAGATSPGLKVPVLMRLANENEFARVGTVDFVDNRVVATTGTVRMRGVFDDPTGHLKAGLFVRIRLPIGSAYQAKLIPDEAIQADQERKYVWVVSAKNEVQYRSVKIGQAVNEMRVIRPPAPGKEGKEGLADGDRVIVSGMQRVRNGVLVEPVMQNPPPPPSVPLVQALAPAPGGTPRPSTPAGAQ